MRTRIETRVNIANAIERIECEVKSYSRAINVVMELHEVAYQDAKRILNRRLTERLIFKTQ